MRALQARDPFVPASQSGLSRAAGHVLPWVAFACFMAWAYGPLDLFHTVWEYGDLFETIVTSAWFSESLAQGRNPLVYPYNYFPEGWLVGSHSVGTLLYLLLVPIVRLGGAVFAANILVLLGSVLGFAGALLLARRHLAPLPATLVALAFAFGGMRWDRALAGQLQVFLASTALPWMLWGVERAFSAASRRRSLGWLALVAALWAFSFSINIYFVFIGAVALVPWLLFAKGSRTLDWKSRLLALVFTSSIFLILSTPALALNLRESAKAEAGYAPIGQVNFDGASLNSFPIPSLFHPWFGRFARQLYKGEPWEQAMANQGLAWSIAAILGIILARRSRAWLAALVLAVVGLMIAQGLTLQWDGRSLQWPVLRPLNEVIWRAGHSLKPEFFVTTDPPVPFADGIPLPGLLLSMIVPFWERGRMFARYALAASLGVVMLGGLLLAELPRLWPKRPVAGRILQLAVAGILLVEIVPPQLSRFPFPPAQHAAYEWLSRQSLEGQGIANMFAAHESTAVLSNNGPNLLAPSYHHQATVAGAAGVYPKQNTVLNEWLATHEHGFWHTDFAEIMRAYRVRYIVLEMKGEWEQGLWEEAKVAKGLQAVDCFPAPAGEAPWNWPICIAEVLPAPSPEFNVLFHDGWSGMEDWGVWAEGTKSEAQFIATSHAPVRLEVSVFPLCVPGKVQRVLLEVNGTELASHEWSDYEPSGCQPWTSEVDVPAELVQVGFNDLTVRAAYADPPQDNPSDTRKLSLGFKRLRVTAQR